VHAGAIAFLDVQLKDEGNRSHPPVTAATARTSQAPHDRLRPWMPLDPAAQPPPARRPERLHPFPEIVPRRDPALDGRAADRPAHPALPWEDAPARAVLRLTCPIGRDLLWSSPPRRGGGPRPAQSPAHRGWTGRARARSSLGSEETR